MDDCPCGSRWDYSDCCDPVIGSVPATSPESLMRSRYTAYVRAEFDHTEAAHVPRLRVYFKRTSTEAMALDAKWLASKLVLPAEASPRTTPAPLSLSPA
ncbi:MAG: YchJ family metal-binding protein [Pseudomonadota bacterium]|nr:YchJ family metal-binding protein [Pseudomonadota bacterium]